MKSILALLPKLTASLIPITKFPCLRVVALGLELGSIFQRTPTIASLTLSLAFPHACACHCQFFVEAIAAGYHQPHIADNLWGAA